MAELNTEPIHFAAAVSVAAFISGRKLARNFSYYRSGKHPESHIKKSDLFILCHKIKMEMFGMHNLMENPEKRNSPFLVAMACEINNAFEELHRKLLFFDADQIEPIMPEIDRQRFLWKNYTDEYFYGNDLNILLESKLPDAMKHIQWGIQQLPASVSY